MNSSQYKILYFQHTSVVNEQDITEDTYIGGHAELDVSEPFMATSLT